MWTNISSLLVNYLIYLMNTDTYNGADKKRNWIEYNGLHDIILTRIIIKHLNS